MLRGARVPIVWLLGACLARATVLSQPDKGESTWERPGDSSVQLLYIKEPAGLVQVASSKYAVTGDFRWGAEAIAVDYHQPRDLLFWSTSSGQIFSSPLRGSRGLAHVDREARLVYQESRWYPRSLAVDHLNDKLYVLDTKSNTIRVSNLEGAERTALGVARRNYRPSQLELDPERGYLFLLDEGEPGSGRYAHLLRMGLDGSRPRLLDPPAVRLELVTGPMALDRGRARLLLSSRRQRTILAADYEGEPLPGGVLERQGDSPLGMALAADELFWVDAGCQRAEGGSVYRCALDAGGRCVANSTRRLHDGEAAGRVRLIRAVSPPPPPAAPGPCAALGCGADEHSSCLADGCACQIGYARAEQRPRCTPVERFLLYEERKVVRTLCLREDGQPGPAGKCHAFAPFLADLASSRRERTGFDYDSLRRQLYFGGKNAIYRADVDSGNSSALLYQRGVFYGPMALDWLSGNLYYTEIEQRGNVSFYVLKVLSARQGVDPQRSSSMLWELGRVHTMAVCPWRGYLFLSVYHNGLKRFRLTRLHVDGTNMTVLLGLNDTAFFSIDHLEKKLYSINANSSTILRSDFNGHNVENVTRIDNVDGITGFLVDEQFLYLKYRSRLLRLDKRTGESRVQVDLNPYDTDMTMDLRLHSSTMFAIDHRNLCAVNNGGCDNFCFAIPTKDGQRLNKLCRCFDGVRCFGDTSSSLRLADIIIKNNM